MLRSSFYALAIASRSGLAADVTSWVLHEFKCSQSQPVRAHLEDHRAAQEVVG